MKKTKKKPTKAKKTLIRKFKVKVPKNPFPGGYVSLVG